MPTTGLCLQDAPQDTARVQYFMNSTLTELGGPGPGILTVQVSDVTLRCLPERDLDTYVQYLSQMDDEPASGAAPEFAQQSNWAVPLVAIISSGVCSQASTTAPCM